MIMLEIIFGSVVFSHGSGCDFFRKKSLLKPDIKALHYLCEWPISVTSSLEILIAESTKEPSVWHYSSNKMIHL